MSEPDPPISAIDEDGAKLQHENDLVRALLNRLDHHSRGERAHAERVAVYAVATGHQLGLRDQDLRDLRYAAQLHDIGKVRVSPSVLSRLGTLDELEIAALRLHAELSMEILAELEFLRPAIPMIRSHHEWWNGAGYPDGLCRQEIPLGARIIAAAEAFDVMTMPPAWAKGASEEEAIADLRQNSGVQFDPAVIDAFLAVQPLIQPVGL